jgi:hypothetical protein
VATLRWMERWGARPDEVGASLPGDELVADPALQTTMAVSVHADADRLWPWLVQLGEDRGGMYSYDRLEQLVGLDIHSATEIRAEWQNLEPGDPVRLVPPGWGPLPDGYAFTVAAVHPPHTLVLRQGQEPWEGIWSFIVRPEAAGRCRLISRTRTKSRSGAAGLLDRMAATVGTPVTWFMTRKMLLTLAQRAEASA